MIERKTGTFVRRAIRITVWIVVGILGLVILAVVAVQFPGVQRYVLRAALTSITEKTQTRIEVGSVSIALTNSVVLNDIYIESRQRDTLLSIRRLTADVNLFGLLSRDIRLKNVRIDTLTAHITRTLLDSTFNFDFILNALSADPSSVSGNPNTPAASPWEISLGEVSLNGIHCTYDDAVTGLAVRLKLGTLHTTFDKFDIDELRFHVGGLSVANTEASVVQSKESPSDGSTNAEVDFGLRSLSLANVSLRYENIVTSERYSGEIGTSTLLAEKIDLPAHHIALKTYLLENSTVAAVPTNAREIYSEKRDATAPPWVVSIDHLSLNSNSVRYDVEGAARTKGLDPNHLRLDGMTLQAENIYFSENRMKADIRHTSFREHSGLDLRELSGGFMLDSLHARLTDFTVETAASRLHQNTLLSYSSLSALQHFPGTVNVKATINESHVAISDLLLFQPSLPIQDAPGSSIRFSARLSGLVRDLRVDEFRAALGDSTSVDLAGSIRGLPDAEAASYEVDVHLFSSGRTDILAIVPDTLMPKSIVLPAAIGMSGSFKGTLRNFSASTVLTTSIGSLRGSVVLSSPRGPGSQNSRWETDITVAEFNVGLLLGDPDTFGPVSLKASAAGTGLRSNDVEAQFHVQVDKAVVYGYPYRQLSLAGTARPNILEGKAEIQDSNIAFTLNGIVGTSSEHPSYKFTLDLKGADLRPLNITSDDIQVAGIITSDLAGRDIDALVGTIDIRNVVMIRNHKRYTIDSLVYTSVRTDGRFHINLDSPILAGRFDGSIPPARVPEALMEHLAQYFTFQGASRAKIRDPRSFSFQIALRDPSALTDVLFPEFHHLSAGTIAGKYDSGRKDLEMNIDIPRLDYNEVRIDSVTVRITSDAGRLRAAIRAGSIADSTFRVTNLQLAGEAGRDSIDVAIESTNGDGSTIVRLAGLFTSVPGGYSLRFKKDGVVFHDVPWSVPADNELLFGKNKFVAHNVVFRDAGHTLSLNSSDEKNPQSPLRIEFNNFDLSTLSRVVEREGGLLGGVLSGNVVLQNLERHMAFTSDLTIKDLSYDRTHVGDVTLHANNQTENVFAVAMNLAGNGNQVAVKGQYRSLTGGSELDLACDFTNVNLASIEPFAFVTVKRLSGAMTGGLHLTGTRKRPSIKGELKFTNAAFTPTFLDSYLRLNDGTIEFGETGVEFKSFELVDTLGNKASLRGHVFTDDFSRFRFDLRAHTERFLVLNKPASRDALYYGTVILDSDISITGDQDRPIVDVQAELDKGTDLVLVLPESELAVEERRGIVRFVDLKAPPNSIMSRQTLSTTVDTTDSKSLSVSLTSNVSVNKDSRLKILIDPVAGDSLVVRGEGTLSFTLDPDGTITLTGRYEILEGSYQLSFGDFIRREFAIAKGSSLRWFGSPYEADVDITAIYTVKASVLDLIQDQLAGMSQEERNKYKQEIPILVHLMMKGKLMSPDIHFKLDLPPGSRGVLGGSVYAKLNELNSQESELNKQVFALLILNRFIPENPLASSGGYLELSSFARSSVSQILSAQLNRLSERYIAGASLNVGVDSYQDYSSGSAEGRTQLKLALSKQLFDERVTVQVGGNVDLEGPRSQANSLNNFAGDLKVMYKLTEDGRWQLQVFRQNSYEGAIDGDITRTGVGIVFMIDFDKLFGVTLKPETER